MPKKKVVLACTECKRRNYTKSRNTSSGSTRLEIKKYCPNCRTHVMHRETK